MKRRDHLMKKRGNRLIMEIGIVLIIILIWGMALASTTVNQDDGGKKAPPELKYDAQKFPKLEWGFNDLNKDGVPDALVTMWNDKVIVFVSDDGKLPWGKETKNRDWNEYFNKAFNAGSEPPQTWNEERAKWGNYTILVDRDGSGRFDGNEDFYYKAMDLNDDGAPEAEYYHLFPAAGSWSNKLHVNLNGERDMSFLNWKIFYYDEEQRYLPGYKYVNNVHGSGFFLNSYSKDVRTAWETPIAWYDFNFDGKTDMVMRAADVIMTEGTLPYESKDKVYSGTLGEYEIAFELNKNISDKKWHSLDMQLTFAKYGGPGMDYKKFEDKLAKIKGLPEAAFLSENMLSTRQQTTRHYLPYLDGHKFATEYDGWEQVWLLFDEDDDDCRWEEMFGKHEPGWVGYADRIGDRIEIDSDYGGKGKLYVGRFDGRIHLYHAENCFWDIDYYALYKGSCDRVNTDEGPVPPDGLRYPKVRYLDENRNGFIDTIEYLTVERKGESEINEKLIRRVSLLDFAGDDEKNRIDVCELIDPRVEAKPCGWKLETWDGNPLKAKDFEGTPNKEIYDKITALYKGVAENMWSSATKLYETAKKCGLNKSENVEDAPEPERTKEALAKLTEIGTPHGYVKLLKAESLREKYHNGYWLRELVFADILEHSGLDQRTLQKYYYTGRIDELCEYVIENCKR